MASNEELAARHGPNPGELVSETEVLTGSEGEMTSH
jgi:hypothetical protein